MGMIFAYWRLSYSFFGLLADEISKWFIFTDLLV